MVDYKQLKIILEDLVKNEFIDLYIQTLSSNVKTIKDFNDLAQFITVFVLIEREYKNHSNDTFSKNYISLIDELRNKYIELLGNIGNNAKPIKDTIYLYEIINKIPNINHNKQLEDVLSQVKKQYQNLKYSSDFQIFVNDALMLGEVLDNDKDYLKKYLERAFVFHLHTMTKYNYHTFLEQLIKNLNINFNFMISIFEKLLDEQYYFSLNNIQRRSIFNWALHFVANIDIYHNHTDWSKLYPQLKLLLFKHLENNQINEAMYLEFFIWHNMGNLFQTQEQMKNFNDEITYPASKYYEKFGEANNLPKPKETISTKGKIKIALVKDRIVNTSVTQVELSLFKNLTKDHEFNNKYELTIYSCNYYEKGQDDSRVTKWFEDLGIKVYNPNSEQIKQFGYYGDHLQRAVNLRNNIIKNETDIMIVGTNNFPVVNFLLANRTATQQIYWSHGNSTYNVDNIDKRISHFDQTNTNYSFKIFNIPLDIKKYHPGENSQMTMQIKSKFPNNAFILGTIGRLVKINCDEYIKTVAEIMKKNPNTIYLACGSGNQDEIKNKVKKYNLEDRFYFTGQIDPKIYGYVIDLWLEPFKTKSGESLSEFMYKKKLFIRLDENKWLIESKKTQKYKNYGKYIWPDSKNAYVELATQLIKNHSLFEKVLSNYYKFLLTYKPDGLKLIDIIKGN